ncbi:MAG: apolipoprotein N-acyltransferase [Propionibacteriaceae bacterium]|nr:apolipoprotein N-acyltransferase [Propionibacteriaceae bacterium]
MRLLPGWLSIPGSLAAGAAIGLAFVPFGLWPLAFAGVAAISLLTGDRSGRAGFGLGYLAGIGLNLVASSWIGMFGWLVAAAFVAVVSLWYGLLGWLLTRVRRLPGWPLWSASCWSLVELGSSLAPFGGFGWNRLAFTTADQPLSGLLPWVGATGVSWLVALLGCAIAAAVRSPRRWVLPGGVVLAVFCLGGALKLVPVPVAGERVTVGMVQGDVGGSGYTYLGETRSVTRYHLAETISLMAKARTGQQAMPDFLLWPENSTDLDPRRDAETRRLIELAATVADRPILVGTISEGPGPDQRQTTGLWWDARTGSGPRYDKRNLVPFGEWIPFREFLLPHIPVLQLVGRESVPGDSPGVLEVTAGGRDGLRLGDIICMELAYDETVYDTVRHGAQVLLVQSSNVTFTGSTQPHQQFQLTRIRAMEARREIVVATTSSFSGLIEADGRVTYKTAESTADSASFSVGVREGVTPGIAMQPYAGWVLASCALLGVLLSCVSWGSTRLDSVAVSA